MKRHYGCIYKITDLRNKKVYIGKTIKTGNALQLYLNKGGGGIYIRRLVKKHGTHNFKKEILGYCETKEELEISEIECIYFFRSFGSDGEHIDDIYGYNLTLGGDGKGFTKGRKHTDQTKQKMSNAAKGRKLSEEHKEKLRQAKLKNPTTYWLGQTFSEEHREKLKKQKQNITEETREKMSKASLGRTGYWKGKKLSQEHIEKIAAQKHGKKLSDEHKAKIAKGVRNAKKNVNNGGSDES